MSRLCSSNSVEQPRLVMVVEPEAKFRFRYNSESGSHGGIPGKGLPNNGYQKAKKIYPTVKLENYHLKKSVYIRVRLCTEELEPHVLSLVGKHAREDGMCYEDLDKELCAKFTNLVIRTKKMEEVLSILTERKKFVRTSLNGNTKGHEKKIESETKMYAKKILGSAVLCFEAFLHTNPKKPICEPLYSEPINNLKTSLKITRISHCSGSWKGDDDVILLCDKVKRGEIKVIFFELGANDSYTWEAEGKFGLADVHHQVAITFKTPKYRENIDKTVSVCLCQNEERSEPVEFRYIADDDLMDHQRKRKRCASTELQNTLNFLESLCRDSSDGSVGDVVQDDQSTLSELLFSKSVNTMQGANTVACVSNPVALQDVSSPSMYSPQINSYEFLSQDTNKTETGGSSPDTLELELDLDCFEELKMSSLRKFLSSYDVPDLGLNDHTEYQMDSVGSVRSLESEFYIPQSALMLHKDVNNQLLEYPTEEQLSLLSLNDSTDSDSDEFDRNLVLSQSRKNPHRSMSPIDIQKLQKESDYLLALKDKVGNTLLHLAVLYSRAVKPILKIMKYSNINIINEYNEEKKTPLHLVTILNKYELVHLLCLNGANPGALDGKGNNCYHIAAQNNSLASLKKLCTLNTDIVNVFNYGGLTPLHLAVIKASCHNSYELLKLLVQVADVNMHDKKTGRTPLHYAAEIKTNVISILLEKPNIDVNSQDFWGNTPLHIACISKNTYAAKCLLEAGADPFMRNFKEVNQSVLEESSEDESCILEESSENKSCLNQESIIVSHVNKLHKMPPWNVASHGQTPLDVSTDNSIIKLLTSAIHPRNKTTDDAHSKNHEEICQLLDKNLNQADWMNITLCLGMSDQVNTLLKDSESPTSSLLKYLKRHYKEQYIVILENVLEMAECHSVLEIVKKACA